MKHGDRVMHRNDPMVASGNASTIWIDAWQASNLTVPEIEPIPSDIYTIPQPQV